MDLGNKVAVVTGSGGGIGEAIAKRFAHEGAHVVVTDINAEAVDRVAAEIGTVGLAGDITREETVRAVAELARGSYGQIDLWHSNAGYAGPREPGLIQENGLWELSWNLHVMAHVYAVREVLPVMLERGEGYLLQTASVVALSTQIEKAAYSVTKHGALALAEWLAATYRPRGIKVSCFCPGPMLTPMLLANNFPPDHPIFTMALTPEQVADVIYNGVLAERFLIVENPDSPDVLARKSRDYDGWIDSMGAGRI